MKKAWKKVLVYLAVVIVLYGLGYLTGQQLARWF